MHTKLVKLNLIEAAQANDEIDFFHISSLVCLQRHSEILTLNYEHFESKFYFHSELC